MSDLRDYAVLTSRRKPTRFVDAPIKNVFLLCQGSQAIAVPCCACHASSAKQLRRVGFVGCAITSDAMEADADCIDKGGKS
jgi:hypothetical protein